VTVWACAAFFCDFFFSFAGWVETNEGTDAGVAEAVFVGDGTGPVVTSDEAGGVDCFAFDTAEAATTANARGAGSDCGEGDLIGPEPGDIEGRDCGDGDEIDRGEGEDFGWTLGVVPDVERFKTNVSGTAVPRLERILPSKLVPPGNSSSNNT
jgi:hypothetical protein